MDAYIPLLQSTLWIALILFLIKLFRGELLLLRKAVSTRLEEGSSVEIGFIKLGEMRRQVDEVANQVKYQQEVISEHQRMINQLVIFSMAWYQFKMLEDLYFKKRKGEYYGYSGDDATDRNLHHLRDHGYISIQGIRQLSNGDDLARLVEVTPAGEFLIDLRRKAEKPES